MTERMRRVNEAVRAVVADALGGLSDPRIGLVTITGVSITPDLREGTVYVAVYGSERKRKATLDGLESAHSYLQACVARELRLKRTPHLSFEYDPSVEEGVRMTKLIDELTPGGSSDDVPGDAGNDSSV
jgi:ribosome-binding factor A